MSTITTLLNTDSGSVSLGVINTNFDNLNDDKIEATQTVALTNKTIDGDLNTLQDIAYSSIKSTSRSGLDVTLVTGTKGDNGELAKWNADGDLVTTDVTITTTAPTTASTHTTIPTSQAVQEAITAQMATKEFWVPVTGGNTITSAYDTAVGDFVTNTPDAAQLVYFNFCIPSDFTSLTEAKVVMIPDATETVSIDIDTDYGASGEQYNNHSEAVSNSTAGANSGQLLEMSVAGALTLLSANDYVGMKINSDTTTLRIIGLRVLYA